MPCLVWEAWTVDNEGTLDSVSLHLEPYSPSMLPAEDAPSICQYLGVRQWVNHDIDAGHHDVDCLELLAQ